MDFSYIVAFNPPSTPEIMETVYHSKYALHQYDEGSNTLYSDWTPETANMDPQTFRQEMEAWLEVFKKKKPALLYDECRNFSYPITPEEQTWMAKSVYAEWVKTGLKKYAHMVPEEMIAELSVEQMFEEILGMKLEGQFPIRNFDKKAAAEEWLHSN